MSKENRFNKKCICYWSKDNKYGSIPNTECEVHGKEVKKTLKKYLNNSLGEKGK